MVTWAVTGFSMVRYNSVGVFWMLSGLLIFGTRLENAMDESICGKRMANHNTRTSTLWGFVLIGVEVLFMYAFTL